jgi:acyl-CoA synthetase (AMP-forming)/AMP-acid ligase II
VERLKAAGAIPIGRTNLASWRKLVLRGDGERPRQGAGVYEAAVLGVPDEMMGERVGAMILVQGTALDMAVVFISPTSNPLGRGGQ